jgi:hypothetical protein
VGKLANYKGNITNIEKDFKMTTRFSETVFSPWLTPVRLASTSNISGTYYNGPNNNGVGATLTVAASSLTVDSVAANVGDRILLQTQTNTNEQGIYIVESIGSTIVLQRAFDQQSLEQLKAGENVAVGAGSVNAGNFYTLVEPLPSTIGVDAMVYNADPSAGGVSFSGGPSVANAPAIFSDTAGNIKPQSTTAGFGFGIAAATGNIAATTGNLIAGSSGHAGTVTSFPATAANGTLILAAVNAGGAFNTTISNAASVGQSQVISVPDSGASTANFIVSKSAADQHITVSGLQADAGPLTSGISTGGFVGLVKAFPTTATSGFIALQGAVNASGNFGTTISNSLAQGQAQVITIPDAGAATGSFVISKSTAPSNNVTFTKVITATSAALATAGKVNVQVHTSATSQFAILDIKVFKSTGLSGGGGDRLLAVSDGTIVFNNAGITAALLGTPILTVWGGTGNPLAVGASEVSTAGADIFLQYTGGATDYTTGSVQVAITMVQVTA